jgi:type II secretory pathway component GspD/PulD (secretin)
MNKHFFGSCQNRLPVQHFHYTRIGQIHNLRYSSNRQPKIMKTPAFPGKILLLSIFLIMANASQLYSYQKRVIICMLPIEYADAEKLADTLAPFLSPQGKISAYSPTNTLIIKDNSTVVRMLIKVIKGKDDLSECQNFQNGTEDNHQIPSD